jgi:hypothetical protein
MMIVSKYLMQSCPFSPLETSPCFTLFESAYSICNAILFPNKYVCSLEKHLFACYLGWQSKICANDLKCNS